MARRDKTPDQIRETHRYKHMPVAVALRIDDFKEICAYWHNRLGACITLDRERFKALRHALIDAEFAVDQVKAAIDAYHRYTQSSRWHQEKPGRCLKFTSFFTAEHIERWSAEGEKLKEQRQATKDRDQKQRQQRTAEQQSEQQQAERAEAIRQWLIGHSPAEKQELIDQAVQAVTTQGGRRVTNPSITNPLIRIELGKAMDQEEVA